MDSSQAIIFMLVSRIIPIKATCQRTKSPLATSKHHLHPYLTVTFIRIGSFRGHWHKTLVSTTVTYLCQDKHTHTLALCQEPCTPQWTPLLSQSAFSSRIHEPPRHTAEQWKDLFCQMESCLISSSYNKSIMVTFTDWENLCTREPTFDHVLKKLHK